MDKWRQGHTHTHKATHTGLYFFCAQLQVCGPSAYIWKDDLRGEEEEAPKVSSDLTPLSSSSSKGWSRLIHRKKKKNPSSVLRMLPEKLSVFITAADVASRWQLFSANNSVSLPSPPFSPFKIPRPLSARHTLRLHTQEL